ncbi:MAG: D-glycerate dehydrogenase [Veillonella sp.]|uniref:2-hydroxyacid dehydrogenase n=1 Tax=Veillonella sp. TaxID=1926307 RepID=UPI0025DB0DB2|nr:D-glycerate dehydrogenase [Veillonella sp.]MBS4913002.1 D-glycerate dehydrogenase [Veillonella sp.]
MTKPNVLVTWPIPDEALALLRTRCDVEVNHEKWTKERLLKAVEGRDALVVVSGTKIDADVCDVLAKKCKIIAGHGVGYNNIDVAAATKVGVWASNTPDVVTDSTADLAFTLLCAVARRVVEADQFIREGNTVWGPTNMLGTQISGKVLGVIGAGRIGQAFIERAKGFNMEILYVDHNDREELNKIGARRVEKEELLQKADFISLHVPLNDGTRHYIGAEELKMMKKTAILVNCSRGPVVDEQALYTALKEKTIGGAGLDVFEKEPEVYKPLFELKNVIMTPHIGTSTIETRINMGEMCARNVFAALDGQTPPQALNKIK